MAHDPKEKFRIFISHKHDDHDFAANLADALEGLSDKMKCFVSGTDLVAGSDWNAEIRSQLMVSHLLVLVFTAPSKNWDWCLYEAGLFTSLGDEHSVVCLYQAAGRVALKCRQGALEPTIATERLAAAAEQIVAGFPKAADTVQAPSGNLTHYPCHRVVLDLRAVSDVQGGIPREARVVEGEGATSTFTLSLFNLTRGLRERTWGDLVDAAGSTGSTWLADLDFRFAAALHEQLFSPSKTTPMPLMDSQTGLRRRSYRPVLYEILREPASGFGSSAQPQALRPLQVTIVLDPVPDSQ